MIRPAENSRLHPAQSITSSFSIPKARENFLRHKFIYGGFIAGILFWIVDACLDTLFFLNGPFVGNLMSLRPGELWMRVFAFFAISGFGFFAQSAINKIRKTELTLKESEEKYRNIFDSTLDGFYRSDSAGNFVIANLAMARILGCESADGLIGRPVLDYWRCPADRDVFLSVLKTRKKVHGYYIKGVKKDGTEVELEATSRIIENNQGDLLGIEGILRDITDGKRTEEKLRLFRTLMDQSNDAVFIIDPESSLILDFNEKACNYLGYTRDEFLGLKVIDIQARMKNDIAAWKAHVARRKREGHTFFEGEHIRKDGSSFPVEVVGNYIISEGKEYVLSVVRDVTERRQVEERLRNATETFRALVNASPLAIIVVNKDHKVETWNPAAEAIFGWKTAEVIGRPLAILPEGAENEHEKLYRQTVSGEFLRGFEARRRRKDGSLVDVRLSTAPLYNGAGETIGVMALIEDITHAKKVASDLRKGEEKYKDLFDSTLDGVYMVDAQGRFITMNPAGAKICGHDDPQEVIGSRAEDYWKYPADREIFLAKLKREKSLSAYPITGIKKNGELRVVELSSRIIEDERGGFAGVQGIMRDVTERRRAEEKLAEREARLRAILESEPECVKLLAPDRTLIEMNPAGLAMMEAESLHDVQGKCVTQIIKPQYRKAFNDLTDRVLLGETGSLEFEIVGLKGTGRWLDTRAVPLRDGSGSICAVLGITRDITERKKTEMALAESEERFRQIAENLNDVIWLADSSLHKLLYINPAYKMMWGSRTDSLYREPFAFLKTVHPEDRSRVEEIVRNMTPAGGVIEYRIIRPDGEIRWIRDRSFPIRDNDGKVYRIAGIAEDITERINAELQIAQAQEALRERERQQKAILSNIPDIAWLKDRESRFIAVNEPFGHACGINPDDLIGKTDLDIWPEDLARQYRNDDEEVMRSGRPKLLEEMLEDARGGRCWIETVKTPIYNNRGEVIGTTGIARDITERKRSEERIKASLLEKEVLLKEVHHRVKNNLQIISSILNLQSEHVKDEHMLSLLRESRNRVKSIALIHEKLYRSKDLARIDFAGYVKTLTEDLFRTYSGKSGVTLRTRIEKVFFDMDKAIYCGLIINELVSNSLKHAFPDGRGEIVIALCEKAGIYTLSVGDNGIGIPPEVGDIENVSSLGLQLVSIITAQLGGKVEVSRGDGAVFKISFTCGKDAAE